MIELLSFNDGPIVYGITLRNAGQWSAKGWTLVPCNDVEREQVLQTRRALAEQLGFPSDAVIVANQVHGRNIEIVDEQLPTNPADGLITTKPGKLLCISVADCCAIMIWDKKFRVVAALHSGWRGTVANIAGHCVRILVERYGIPPKHLHAWLSPCASGKHYRVKQDVASLFPQSVVPLGNGEFLYDNAAEIRMQLLQAGLLYSCITTSGYCTIADVRFHSYRRDGAQAGRMAAFIGIKP